MDHGGGGSWIVAEICSDLMDVVGLIWWIVAKIWFDFFFGISDGGWDLVRFWVLLCCLRISGGGCCCFSGFCGESVGLRFWVLWWIFMGLSVGFSASASFFFFFSVVMAGMDIGLLGWDGRVWVCWIDRWVWVVGVFFRWWWMGWVWVCYVEIDGQVLLGWEWRRGRERKKYNWRIKK